MSRLWRPSTFVSNSRDGTRFNMSTRLKEVSLLTAVALGLASAGTSCVCPPCSNAAAASPTAGAGQGAAVAQSSSSSSTGTSATAAAPAGKRLLIWDGEGHGAGSSAKSWADCDKKPDCKASLAPAPGSGKDGSVGLKLGTDGPGWKGGGWNWFGWWPETSGTDLTPYQNISFWMRLDPKTPDMMPEPGSITVSVRSSKNKGESQSVSMDKFGKDLPDGKWHKIVIPLAEFTKDKPKFDPGTAWEFGVGIWTADPRTLAILVDEIAAENQ
jgi:hypothetical protein